MVPVVRGEVKISSVRQVVTDAAHHRGMIAIAQFRHEYADRECTTAAKRTSHEIGLIIKLLSCLFYPLARFFRNRSSRRVVQHNRNGRGV